jgi:membrane protease YdiL (CAAX protease family)
MGARLDAGREVALVFLFIAAVTVLVSRAPIPALHDYRHLILAALFLGTAVRMSERQPDGVARYGLTLGGLLERSDAGRPGLWAAVSDLATALWRAAPAGIREVGAAMQIAMLVFPAFIAGFYFWHRPVLDFRLELPDALPSYLLTQIVVVALPEEALFRGYFQGRGRECFTTRTRLLGARLSVPAWLLQSLLFALLHVATDLRPTRLAVFFPGLLFGWLREFRGGIGAAIILHALCNLLADVLARSWF